MADIICSLKERVHWVRHPGKNLHLVSNNDKKLKLSIYKYKKIYLHTKFHNFSPTNMTPTLELEAPILLFVPVAFFLPFDFFLTLAVFNFFVTF
jgi:hypothetical protein